MSLTSSHLSLPYLAPAQAQKHVTHNEALRALDVLVQLSVISDELGAPPADPQEGMRYLVANTAEGVWAQKVNSIAAYLDGAWHYFAPQSGWLCYVQSRAQSVVFDGQHWQVSGEDISVTGINDAPLLGVNTQADSVNRLAVKSEASLLSHDVGGSHQMKINKAGEADTASLLLQAAYSGHAEIGLTGNNDLHVKVSADGAQWSDALIASTRGVDTPLGTHPDLYVHGIDNSGAAQAVLGPPNVLTMAVSRGTDSLLAGRVYFCAFYVDRPTQYLGGVCAILSAASQSGAVIRAGLYHLGVPDGNRWAVGDRIADLGSQPADVTGHLDFDLPAPVTLSPGWYVHAFGADASGVSVRSVRWSTPGHTRYMQYSSGGSADFRVTGASRYIYENGRQDLIASGFPQVWPNTVQCATSVLTYTSHFIVPKWTPWS